MKHIDKMYKPNVAILPLGGLNGANTMGPKEAAYCCKHFLPTPTQIITMHHPNVDAHEEFENYCIKYEVEGKTLIHPRKWFE